MRDDYLNAVIRRGDELNRLERAAAALPERSSVFRLAVAFAMGALVALFPSVCSAQAFLQWI